MLQVSSKLCARSNRSMTGNVYLLTVKCCLQDAAHILRPSHHTLAGQQPLREELYHAIAAMQARLSAAERRRNLAAKDLNRSKQELERIRGLAKAGKATKQRLVDSAAAEAEWLTKPGANGIIAMTAGPLTRLVRTAGLVHILLCSRHNRFYGIASARMLR